MQCSISDTISTNSMNIENICHQKKSIFTCIVENINSVNKQVIVYSGYPQCNIMNMYLQYQHSNRHSDDRLNHRNSWQDCPNMFHWYSSSHSQPSCKNLEYYTNKVMMFDSMKLMLQTALLSLPSTVVANADVMFTIIAV